MEKKVKIELHISNDQFEKIKKEAEERNAQDTNHKWTAKSLMVVWAYHGIEKRIIECSQTNRLKPLDQYDRD